MSNAFQSLNDTLQGLSDQEATEKVTHWLEHDCGKLDFFDVKPFLDVADILVAGDEPMLALKVLESVPGFYRDHYPIAMQDKRDQIISLLATPGFYVTNHYDTMVRSEQAVATIQGTMRGNFILADVKAYNDKGLKPHIVDLGPGEYWLPIGLSKLGHKFTYQPIGLCTEAHEKAALFLAEELKAPTDDQPRMYTACEIIEHLHNESDLKADCLRVKCDPDVIHVSTPKYSFDGTMKKFKWWEMGDLGHVRTYTPTEFRTVMVKLFPEYRWSYIDGQPMHMRGLRNGSILGDLK